jgi:hypothetical protein
MSYRIGISRESFIFMAIMPPPVSSWIEISSGLTMYRRGLSGGYYVLDYSADGGLTWERIVALDPTEDNPVIDSLSIYRHRIVGTAYRVDQELTPTGYAGTEDIDWENIYST